VLSVFRYLEPFKRDSTTDRHYDSKSRPSLYVARMKAISKVTVVDCGRGIATGRSPKSRQSYSFFALITRAISHQRMCCKG